MLVPSISSMPMCIDWESPTVSVAQKKKENSDVMDHELQANKDQHLQALSGRKDEEQGGDSTR